MPKTSTARVVAPRERFQRANASRMDGRVITLTLPVELHTRLRRHCLETDQSMNLYLTNLIVDDLKKR
jgi:hypothetical protein